MGESVVAGIKTNGLVFPARFAFHPISICRNFLKKGKRSRSALRNLRKKWHRTMEMKQEKTLYQRLGGYDVIAGIVDDFLGRMRQDPKFQRFATRSLDSRNRARQLLVDQMCALSGGPCLYIGRDMKTSHAGLDITQSEWRANMEHAAAALAKFSIPKKETEEFLAIISRFRKDIIDQ